MTEAGDTPAVLRRLQRRQATYDEMIGYARDALREGRQLSLRAIAADMGMTAPALYRYVDSHAQLQTALVHAIYTDVLAELDAAVLAWPEDKPGLRLYASLRAFRRWALSTPAEFRLVFGQPLHGWESEAAQEGLPPAVRFYAHFMHALVQLRRLGQIRDITAAEVPPSVTGEVERLLGRWSASSEFADTSPGLWWGGLRDWVMLCGVLRMEVDGLVPRTMVADASIFVDMLVGIGLRNGASEADLRRAIGQAFLPA